MTIHSIDKAIQVIELLTATRYGYGVLFISEQLGFSPTTTYRILQTLMRRGYVEKTENGKYRLGMRFIEIGSAILNRIDLRAEARPFMRALASEVGEFVVLGIPNGDVVVCVETATADQNIRMDIQSGTSFPLHLSAMGQCLLAFGLRSDGPSGRVHSDPSPQGSKVPIDMSESKKAEIRRQGYAVERATEGNELGFLGIAAPIFDYLNRIVASLSVIAPSARVGDDRVSQIGELVCSAAESISSRLGRSHQDAK